MNQTRNCIVRVEQRVSKDSHETIDVETEAIFHCFGDSLIYRDCKQFLTTLAIVEISENGQVLGVEPW